MWYPITVQLNQQHSPYQLPEFWRPVFLRYQSTSNQMEKTTSLMHTFTIITWNMFLHQQLSFTVVSISHNQQLSPLCTATTWAFRWERWLARYQHLGQAYGLSPVCMRMCVVRLNFLIKLFPQKGHVCPLWSLRLWVEKLWPGVMVSRDRDAPGARTAPSWVYSESSKEPAMETSPLESLSLAVHP